MFNRIAALLALAFVLLAADFASAESQYIRRTPGAKSVIVFVHGILGNAASTWKNSNGAYWPELLKGDATFDASDIYVYDYPSQFRGGNFSIDQITDNARLVFDSDDIPSHAEIMFVTHSMGGLVVRAYLLKYRAVAAKTKFITFLSTPTTGSDLVGLAGLFSTNPSLFDMKPMDAASTSYLATLQSNWLAAGLRIPSFCAYETQPTFVKMVVNISSATNLCTERLDPVIADHISIAKPSNRSDTSYLAFKSAYKIHASKITASCAPVYVESPPAITTKCNLTRDEAKALSLETIDRVSGKLALVLSKKSLGLFPAMDAYQRDPSDANWRSVQSEAAGLLTIVRDASSAVISFDATLRPELGGQIRELTNPDGVRQALMKIQTSSLRPREIAVGNLVTGNKPSRENLGVVRASLEQLVETLSNDLRQLRKSLAQV
ncbi:alpha/beta fold hydrolase [Bradyrhizobium sp. LjRoot220]|uniref:esterase/lipase family protein n=1 Tax=Bradyrhizobium sp. LjRoot220 TaxID=3342284 RepID=UPI003ECD2FBB